MDEVFPKENLSRVTKTVTITVPEFTHLWANTKGHKVCGSQFSNCDYHDFLFATKRNAKHCTFYKDRIDVSEHLSTNITDTLHAGWVTHAHYSGRSRHVLDETPALHPDFEVIYQKRWRYTERKDIKLGEWVVAQRSKCGQFVTVFKTIA